MQMLRTLLLVLLISPAYAWEKHQNLMSQIVDSKMASERAYLKLVVVIPSEVDQKKMISKVAAELEVDAEKIPIQKPGKMSLKDFLQGQSIDEPDFGMDQNLPDSADPKDDRKWMGGKTGPTSQGFRHMYFAGMEWSSPMRTLQIPKRPIGQSPERISKLKAVSEKFLQEKNLFWGLRTLLWSMHFMQDLHQPFHTMQVPYFRMLPLKSLLKNFVGRSTQVIANYHYAYEGLINESIQEGKVSKLASCFEISESLSSLSDHPEVKLSRAKAEDIGVPLFKLWDEQLKDPEVNLPEGLGEIDYYSFLHANPDEEEQKEKVVQVELLLKHTCELLKHMSAQTWAELDHARILN